MILPCTILPFLVWCVCVIGFLFHSYSPDISSKFLYEPQNTTTWIGSVAQFSCQIRNALPPATIEWRKNGMLLSSNERVLIFDRGVLQIKETTKSDEGEYSCTARNVVHARLSQSASLFVETGWCFCICQHF